MDKAVKIILGVLLVLGGLFWALVSLGVISPSFDFIISDFINIIQPPHFLL